MGASIGGVADSMFAAFQAFISPESFSLTESIAVRSVVVVGGMGHVPGVVLVGSILAALPEALQTVVEPMQKIVRARHHRGRRAASIAAWACDGCHGCHLVRPSCRLVARALAQGQIFGGEDTARDATRSSQADKWLTA